VVIIPLLYKLRPLFVHSEPEWTLTVSLKCSCKNGIFLLLFTSNSRNFRIFGKYLTVNYGLVPATYGKGYGRVRGCKHWRLEAS
jgi:hypothetical protein